MSAIGTSGGSFDFSAIAARNQAIGAAAEDTTPAPSAAPVSMNTDAPHYSMSGFANEGKRIASQHLGFFGRLRVMATQHIILMLLAVASLVVMFIIVIAFLGKKEGLSPRASKIYTQTKKVFETGQPTYQKYKSALNGQADPVEYSDMKQLFKGGNFTPASIDQFV